jgi:hypothetical protein
MTWRWTSSLDGVSEIALVVATSADPEAATRAGQDADEELLRRLVGMTS